MKIKLLIFILAATVLVAHPNEGFSQAPNLGTAANFVLFTVSGAVGNTGSSHFVGNIGTNSGAITGFGGAVVGTLYTADAVTAQCSTDLMSAFSQLSATTATNTSHTPAFGAGETLFAGVYSIGGAASIAGTLTLDAQGDPNAVFIFKAGGALTTGASSTIILINGASASNIFWVAEGAIAMATITVMKGTLISHNGAVSMGSGCNLEGRLFSTTGAVSVYGDSASIGPFPVVNFRQAPNLGTAASFVLFTSGGAVGNTGVSHISGNIGTNAGAVNGFQTSTVIGNTYVADAVTSKCSTDLLAAYDQLNSTNFTNLHGPILGNGEHLNSGVYEIAAAGALAGTLTLDAQGDSTAVFIFKVGGAFSVGASSSIILLNNATPCNIFLIAEGAVTIAASSIMKGTFIAHNGAISMSDNGVLEGRMFSTTGAVNLAASSITIAMGCNTTTSWTGAINTDWNISGNWLYFALPAPNNNVTIPAGLTNYPILNSGTGYVQNLTIENTASLMVTGAKLKISGTIVNTGSFDASGGTIEMNGTSLQSIPANTFSNNSLFNLIVSNNVTLLGRQNLSGNLSFGSSNNTLSTNGFLILKSAATGTASIGDMTTTVADNTTVISGNKFDGNVTVERYYPPVRSWRLVTSPLSGAGTIFDTWQNGGNYLDGVGTWVSGAGANLLTNGMDPSVQNTSSLKIGSNLKAVTNTRTTFLSDSTGILTNKPDNKGYFIFVRGDRTQNNFTYGQSNPTTLISSGKLQTGNLQFDIAAGDGIYNLIGNPYASSVDFMKLDRTNLSNKFYVWDPYLNLAKGGYVAMVGNPFNNADTTYDVIPAGRISDTRIIQSSQAFFVVKDIAGAPSSLKFSEAAKSPDTSANKSMFRPMQPLDKMGSLRTNLLLLNADGSTDLADGNLIQFDDRFNAAADNLDAIKFGNIGENFGLLVNTTTLAVNRRPSLHNNDTIFYKFTKQRQIKYQFQFIPSNLNTTLVPMLEDSYTKKVKPLSITDISTVNFVVDANAASQVATRFRIVFVATKILPVTYTSVKASQQNNDISIAWDVETEININRYEVETSVDGRLFTKATTTNTKSVNGGNASYNWIHVNPGQGVHFYRIKNCNLNGSSNYSQVVKVSLDKKSETISVYPNPVVDGVIGLQLSNQQKGLYTIRLFNSNGEVILHKEIIYPRGSSAQTIVPAQKLLRGVYSLEVTKPGNDKTTINVLVQ